MRLDKETLEAINNNKIAFMFLFFCAVIWMLWGELQKERLKNETFKEQQLQDVTRDRDFWKNFSQVQADRKDRASVVDTVYLPASYPIRTK